MPRPRNPVPTYRLHKSSGQAVVTVNVGERRRDILLGAYDSPESKTEYRRVLTDLSAGRLFSGAPADLTVNELLVRFIAWATDYYKNPDGTRTSELDDITHAVRPLRELLGHTPAREFGPLAFKRVRDEMIAKNWGRTTVNQQAQRVKRVIRFAVENELVPPDRWQALRAVKGLAAGRTSAREPEPVGPVEDATVDATLPFLNRHIAGLIEFQLLTGCRPGEACNLRRCDIDTTGEAVWVYRPPTHKTAWKGKKRTIAIGPKGQRLLKRFFTEDPAAYLFSPQRAMAEHHEERAANRQTPRYPSHEKRNGQKRKAAPHRSPQAKYTTTAYNRAVARACELAFPPPAPLAKQADETVANWKARLTDQQKTERAAWVNEHRWHVNQLRHSAATRVRREFGLEAASVFLGHINPDTTLIYAAKNEALAAMVAAKLG